MTSKEIRQKFLEFFKERGHAIVPSASLVPVNDPSTLFVSAGMQPMMPYLLGEKHPLGKRIADSQRSFRAQDIEEVGDNRHTTFFEMLGNWSFGDYFKKEQLQWFFEFLTKEVGLDPKKLYVTVFGGSDQIPRDSESVRIWKEIFASAGIEANDVEDAAEKGMQGRLPAGRQGRIFYYGEEKNWWSRSGTPSEMPAGEPGGPDSEVFYEFSDVEHNPSYGTFCHPNCDCGRYVEIGNSVFMEYQKKEDGTFGPLPEKNIDFGGGLERIAEASGNNPDIFMIDSLYPLIEKIKEISGKEYEGEAKRSFQVITDHIRAAVMLASDGVTPSNKAQGYVLRRLIRRAVRYGRLLGIEKSFVGKLVETVSKIYEEAYPELTGRQEHIISVLSQEEEKFQGTISRGLKEIEKMAELDGKIAFYLYETYGFPFELTEEIARERGQKVAYGEFRSEFEKHQEVSRAGQEKKFGGHGLYLKTGEVTIRDQSEVEKVTRLHTATHLLHQALRQALGPEVRQNGSDITVERTRFDFNFSRKLTPEELKQVENLVNEKVKEDLSVSFVELPKADAEKTGALYFFKERYPDKVKVYFIGPTLETAWSKEFCGGPHVKHTAEVGKFKITKEEAVGSGLRRIRAIVE